MAHTKQEPILIAICRGCGEQIGFDDLENSKMVQVWNTQLVKYQWDGPYHAQCAEKAKEGGP